jgi:hypothetical protein
METIKTFEQRNNISKEIDNINTVLDQAEKRGTIFNDTLEALEGYRDYLYNQIVDFDKKSLKQNR